VLYGVALPILETVRRWHQLGDLSIWPFWLDDWLIGALLLYGVWRTRNGAASGQAYLSAAWGFTCAMGYMSFFSQLSAINQPDPSGVPPVIVVTVKGVGVALAILALVGVLRWKPKT